MKNPRIDLGKVLATSTLAILAVHRLLVGGTAFVSAFWQVKNFTSLSNIAAKPFSFLVPPRVVLQTAVRLDLLVELAADLSSSSLSSLSDDLLFP